MKISLSTLLTVLFVGLKLTGYINWSWVWVLSPLWIGLVIYLVVLFFFCVAAGLLGGRVYIKKKK